MAAATEAVATVRVRQHPHEGALVHKLDAGMHDRVILATTATARTQPGGSSNLDTQTMEIVRVHAVEFSKTAAPLSGGASPSRARRPSSPHRALEERAGKDSAPVPAGIGLGARFPPPFHLPDDLYVDDAVALAIVEVQQHDLLPGAERE